MINSSIEHIAETQSNRAVHIFQCITVNISNTTVRLANQKFAGFVVKYVLIFYVSYCRFEGCYNLPSVLLLNAADNPSGSVISNSRFSNNTDGNANAYLKAVDSVISDNNMTAITAIMSDIKFSGQNLIQNNRYTEGAGITLWSPNTNFVETGKLYMLNNTAQNHGGAILVKGRLFPISSLYKNSVYDYCSLASAGQNNTCSLFR